MWNRSTILSVDIRKHQALHINGLSPLSITLSRPITMLCGIGGIPWNYPRYSHIQIECKKCQEKFH